MLFKVFNLLGCERCYFLTTGCYIIKKKNSVAGAEIAVSKHK